MIRLVLIPLLMYAMLASSVEALERLGPDGRPLVRTIKIAADYNYPPYEFLDENGEPAGYNVDLTYAIAEVMGFDIKLVMTDWESAYSGLLSGKYDVLQGIAYSDERAQRIRFSAPHSIVNQSLFARKDGPKISDVSELDQHEVIVQNASIMHEYLLQNHPNTIIIPVATHSDALRLLAAGKHDFALTANLPSLYLSKEMGLSNIEPIGRPVAGQRLGYGTLINNEEILTLFSEGLAILKNTGRQQAIYDKWLGALDNNKLQLRELGQYAFYTTLVLLVVLGGIVIWNNMLRKEVEKRSRLLKEQQAQLIQADKMASLGVLVSGVAHEINNPTGLLMLNLPILREAWLDALPYLDEVEQQQGELRLAGLSYQRLKSELPYLLDEMQQSTDKIRNIVNDLKDFARAQPDDISEQVNINETVAMAVRLVDKSIRNASQQFSLQLAEQPLLVKGNSQRIEQVLINLILNACDALQANPQSQGKLYVSTRLNSDTQEVAIDIEDDGVGIAKADLVRLTEPFFTTKREQGGTGLGLSVSASIIQAHGGRLLFTSEPRLGTKVTVALPLMHIGN
ncbi:transporter substrate-binding domain-containing protein [Maribrevibacterium harenarium]|uniref:histidine kinase n=1 Tax=Maribrevibacterium harenarium TaxID=2589817 RepID=A0A501X032_9GAMM|nr:transporter substrate-binding domain-containing protein [Maribrevibacterium harenarium]TPE54155.1 transporter substrate-binding domain-containing protein [Maribrevibacterium harenarium]